MSNLRPGRGVPFEAGPFKAGVLLVRFLSDVTGVVLINLELPSADAHAQHNPPLHAAATSCVTLNRGI